jgi:hypothetical protein
MRRTSDDEPSHAVGEPNSSGRTDGPAFSHLVVIHILNRILVSQGIETATWKINLSSRRGIKHGKMEV